jgi:heptosyltransferase II
VSRRVLLFAPNWLGDAVMALPAIADVRRAWPDDVIDVAARPSIAPLVALMPGMRRAVLLQDRRAGIDAVRAGGYDVALVFPNSFHSAWVARSGGVPERWGYATEFRRVLLTRAVAAPVRVHQAAYFQHLTAALGFAAGPLVPRLDLPDEALAEGRAHLDARGWDARTPLVAVAPGAAFGGAKKWPAASFAATIDALAADGVRAVLIGAPADRRAAAEVLAAVRAGTRPIDLTGATDLPQLAGVLRHCRALVTNDSGAMHFAAALGTDVTAIFGPTNEHETRPLGPARATVLHGDVWCRPCMLRECPLTQRCMAQVSPDAVARETRVSL